MLRTIHSIPDSCPECGSENLGGKQMLLYEESNTVLCHFCGIIMVLQEDYEEEAQDEYEVTASFLSCPHCHTVNEIQVEEGKEWCAGCGLDPSRTDYPSEEIAHLWREGAGIRSFMERGVPRKTSRMYRFLTSLCGPHCSFAENCPQTTGNFTQCYKEEFFEGDLDFLPGKEEEMGRRKNRKARRKERKEQERILREKERTVLVYARSGWYERAYCNETKDTQESQHTRSGSGTQGLSEIAFDHSKS